MKNVINFYLQSYYCALNLSLALFDRELFWCPSTYYGNIRIPGIVGIYVKYQNSAGIGQGRQLAHRTVQLSSKVSSESQWQTGQAESGWETGE